MLTDLLLHSGFPGFHYSRVLSGRCSRCGQGAVVASDGFMAVLCDNCGRHSQYDQPNPRRTILETLGVLARRTSRCLMRLKAAGRPNVVDITPEGAS